MPLQLQRAPELAQLAAEGSGMGIEQPRDLHSQRAATGDDSPGGQVLPGSANNRKRVHPRMPPEPAIFILDQRLQIARRHIIESDRIAPDSLLIRKAPQRRAIFRYHHPSRRHLMQRQRPQTIGRQHRQP